MKICSQLVAVLGGLVVALSASRAEAQFTLFDCFGQDHDVTIVTSLGDLGNGSGTTILGVVSVPGGSGTTFGLFFFQPDHNALTVKVFESSDWLAYTYEGEVVADPFDCGWANNSPQGGLCSLGTAPPAVAASGGGNPNSK